MQPITLIVFSLVSVLMAGTVSAQPAKGENECVSALTL
jgi:hypothetical protein